MELLVIQSPPVSRYSVPLPQHLFLRHSQPMLFRYTRDQVSCPYKTASNITVLRILMSMFLVIVLEDDILDRTGPDRTGPDRTGPDSRGLPECTRNLLLISLCVQL